MRLSDFDYCLPDGLIALEPPKMRDAARVMTLDRHSGAIGETVISLLPEMLFPNDLLVLNDTRVLSARLFGLKESGGKVEIFLVRRVDSERETWEVLLRSSKPCRSGVRILLQEGVVATVISADEGESRFVSFAGITDFFSWLDRNGQTPLPPYIRRLPEDDDKERYQTVFARERGAVAAPTAGLHFTADLLEKIRQMGVTIATLTLHVGLGTFIPVRCDNPEEHRMHKEHYSLPEETVDAIARCRSAGGRVIAVGTTVARTLEYAAVNGKPVAGGGEADIFIYPGYRFQVADALITNFHLPKSTLLMLVSAFAGLDSTLAAYQEAINRGFRFYSYGDAMFIY